MNSVSAELSRLSEPSVAKGFEPRVLIHYDIRSGDGRTRRRVDRFLYGSRQAKKVRGEMKAYHYPGIIETTGGRHFGQSVLILSPEAAEEVLRLLVELHVPHERVDILSPS